MSRRPTQLSAMPTTMVTTMNHRFRRRPVGRQRITLQLYCENGLPLRINQPPSRHQRHPHPQLLSMGQRNPPCVVVGTRLAALSITIRSASCWSVALSRTWWRCGRSATKMAMKVGHRTTIIRHWALLNLHLYIPFQCTLATDLGWKTTPPSSLQGTPDRSTVCA